MQKTTSTQQQRTAPHRLEYLLLFLLSFAINNYQARYIISPLDYIYADMLGYLERAWRIVVGSPFIAYDTFYPPGTSYFFAVIFRIFGFASGLQVIVTLQCILLAGAVVLTAMTAYELFGRRLAALLCALAACWFWPFTALSSFFMAEALFVFQILLGQYLFIRALKRGGSQKFFLTLGLLFGLTFLIKGQGVCVFAAVLICMLLPFGRHLISRLPLFAAGFLLPLVLQMGLNSAIVGKPIFYAAGNDAFNIYLGQSRREAIVCADIEKNLFYVFHNNNAYFDHRLLTPIGLPASVLDRSFFRQKTLELWSNNPKLQFIRSAQSVNELFSGIEHWPFRSAAHLIKQDRFFKWIAIIFALVPALFTLVFAALRKDYGAQALILGLPLLFISATAFISMGQPRYLIPFMYNLFLLSIPFYLELKRVIAASQQKPLAAPFRLEKPKDKTVAKYNSKIEAALLALLLMGIGLFYTRLVAHALHPPQIQISLPDETAYKNFKLPGKKVVSWIELGRNNELTWGLKNKSETFPYEVFLKNFSIANTSPPQSSKVHWRIRADKEQGAVIDLRFPRKGAISDIALYLTEDRELYQTSRFRTDNLNLVSEKPHLGRWIHFPVSEIELQKGRKFIQIKPISGGGTGISALVIFEKVSDEQ